MAASSGGRRAVQQEELRRLMREKQRQGKDRKRLDSPFAKYNRLGHLSCSLCNAPVKTERLWQTHVLGKQHKEKVAELKGVKDTVPGPAAPSPPHPAKRKAGDAELDGTKKKNGSSNQAQVSSSGLPTDFFDRAGKESAKVSGLSLIAASCGEEEEEEEDEEEEGKEKSGSSQILPKGQKSEFPPPTQEKEAPSGLPADFFDTGGPPAPLVSHSGSILKAEIQEKELERKENTAEALPEGFFDDPEVDAKVRKVDAPKDQMDKEWDEFQKAMRQVNTISEAIVAEEDEEGRLDRQIGEIDEQIECYRRIEALRHRQDVFKDKLRESLLLRAAQDQADDDNSGSEDDGELRDLLSQDWRVKGTLL
ncbi:zinc finger protein 830 [Tachyglossus aculeatus]|uniref:zinc finger protein 830 n=1 Tax=Tachyglossus aculeatus TaxID=9261 RepID=UPI0018F4CDA0|nr:zinc finger protein 830 [Tachyglossus aculeatus]